MPKTPTTLTLDQEVIRAVKIKAARSGRGDSEVIEDSLRRDLGLGALEQLGSQVKPAREIAGLELADAELHEMRSRRRVGGAALGR